MIYRMIGHAQNHPAAKLVPEDPGRCSEALYTGSVYSGRFSANNFNRDDFYFLDLIESYCVPVVSSKFKSVCEEAGVNGLSFKQTVVTWGKEDILGWIGDATNGFFTIQPQIVQVIDDTISPLKFFPKLKKFKNENYVVTRPLPPGVDIAVDLKKPHIVLCSDDFRTLCVASSLNVSFCDVPASF